MISVAHSEAHEANRLAVGHVHQDLGA